MKKKRKNLKVNIIFFLKIVSLIFFMAILTSGIVAMFLYGHLRPFISLLLTLLYLVFVSNFLATLTVLCLKK